MIATLQNFQFIPPTLTFPINTRMVVKIGKNMAQSNIYSGSDRFFVIGVEGMGIEIAESDPLYETQSFEFQFESAGLFVIRCLNYPQAKCHVQVMGSSCTVAPVCLQEVFVYRKRSSPKNKVLPASERPFRITECDIQMFQGVVGECVESEDEDAYVDRMRQGQKQEKQVASPPIMKHVSRYEALSEQRQRTVPEEDEVNDDSLSCFHDFSKDASIKRQSPFIVALSNTDSFSTYHTSYPLHNHNKIEALSTYSELCDQLPFTQQAQEPQSRGGRKNSDPLIQKVKDDSNSPIKKFRQYTNKQQEYTSSESDDKIGIVPKFIQDLLKRLSKRRDDYTIDQLRLKELLDQDSQVTAYYLDEGILRLKIHNQRFQVRVFVLPSLNVKKLINYSDKFIKFSSNKMLNNLKNKVGETYKSTKEKINNKVDLVKEKYYESKDKKQEPNVNFREMEEEEQKEENDEKPIPVSQFDQFTKNVRDGAISLAEKVSVAKTTAQNKLSNIDLQIKKKIIEEKKAMNQWIATKADERIVSTFHNMAPKASQAVKDDHMPQCFKEFTDDAIESLWSDLTDLVRFELRVYMINPEISLSRTPDKYCCLRPWYMLRNNYLYAVFPFDKTFWQQTRTWSYFFWKVLQCCPYYGIQAFAFFILFIAIDKSEEYQCVNYILSYKQSQFITAGILNAVIGYFQYFYCATIEPSKTAQNDFINQQHDVIQDSTKNPYQVLNLNYCFKEGPGSGVNISVQIISYFSQIIMIWIVYAMMLRSKSCVADIEDTLKLTKQQRGGRLKWFMLYDLFIFLFSFGLLVLIYFYVYYIPNMTFQMYNEASGIFYFAKLIYGTLSFPFLIFSLDIFIKLFTTAKPTAYDQYANVIPIISKMKLKYQEIPSTDEEGQIIDIEDILTPK